MRSITNLEYEHYIESYVFAYYLNVMQNDNSIIARLHGLFTLDNPGLGTANDLQFILMENILPYQKTGTLVYDIKGDAQRVNFRLFRINTIAFRLLISKCFLLTIILEFSEAKRSFEGNQF